MAANVFAPTGLVWCRNMFGAAPTAQAQVYYIKKGYSTAIGIGDIVKTGTSGNQGYVVLSADGDTSGLGVFAGVLPYYDTVLQQTAHGLNGSWPTSANPAADVPCLVYSDILCTFRAQANGGTFAQSWRGQNCTWTTTTNGAPNAAGISTLSLNATVATTSTYPFRILGVAGVPGGPSDPANTSPVLEISFNPNWLESQVATGI